MEVVSSSETIPFDPDNRVIDSDSPLGMSYRCETDLFIVTAYQSADDGMTGGNAVHHVTITAKDSGTVINSVEAVVAGWGEYYDRVGVTAGDKVETGPVDDNTVVTVENINAGTFSFQGGIEAVVFTDLTVYYTSTAYSCEHTFGDDYHNDGETHSRKCTKCSEFVGGEEHTFVEHVCACDATETTKMTETLPFSGNAFLEDGGYFYEGENFTVSGTAASTVADGITIGNGERLTIAAKDSSLTIERIEADLIMGGRDYLFIEISSGEKLEKGSVEAPATVTVTNVNASSFTFSGQSGKNACKLTDITVYYTDGKIAHVLSDECVDNGDGTHTYSCTKCDDYGVTEEHTFVNGVCVCGAEDPSEFVISEEVRYNKDNCTVYQIAKELGRPYNTIKNEIARGTVLLYGGKVSRYKADAVEAAYLEHRKECRRKALMITPQMKS